MKHTGGPDPSGEEQKEQKEQKKLERKGCELALDSRGGIIQFYNGEFPKGIDGTAIFGYFKQWEARDACLTKRGKGGMKTVKRILRTAAFLFGLLFLVWVIILTLRPKRTDGTLCLDIFYRQEPHTVDVVFLGSSRIGVSEAANNCWQTEGISAYNFWGSGQTFWDSYHYLIEAFKYQQPKVVVMEVNAATYAVDYKDEYRQISNVLGMRPSRNRIAAIWDAVPPERRADFLVELPLTHGSYDELTEEDFRYYPWSETPASKGDYEPLYGTLRAEPLTPEEIAQITEVAEIQEKEEKYLQKTIELCFAHGVPLLLVSVPDPYPLAKQPYLNRVSEIAGAYGLPFLNYDLIDIGLNRETDFIDIAHLNVNGARKVCRHLGSYLKETYGLPDHRGDPDYASWDENGHLREGKILNKITNLHSYIAELAGESFYGGEHYGYRYFITEYKKDSRTGEEQTAMLNEALRQIGCDLTAGDTVLNTWALDSLDPGSVQFAGVNDALAGLDLGGVHFEANPQTLEVMVNGEVIRTITNEGITITVYDPRLDEVVDSVEFLGSTGYLARR